MMLRTMDYDGETYFDSRDVSKAIKIVHSIRRRIINNGCIIMEVKTNGGAQKVLYINRENANHLICNARKITEQEKRNIVSSNGLEFNLTTNCKQAQFSVFLRDAILSVFNDIEVEIKEEFFICKGYRVDFYIPTFNLIVEFDEQHHNVKSNSLLDTMRESNIRKEIENSGIVFIRVKNDDIIRGIAKIIHHCTHWFIINHY